MRRIAPISICLALTLCAPVATRAAWLPNGTPVATITGEQLWPHVCSDGRDGAFVVWRQQGTTMGQHLTRDGDVAPGWSAAGLLVPPARSYEHYRVDPIAPIPDGEGGVYVVGFEGERCDAHCAGNTGTLFVQHLDVRGERVTGWPEEGMPVEHTPIHPHLEPAVYAIANGHRGLLVEWPGADGTHLQSIDRDGEVRWGPDGVVLGVNGAPVPDGEGGAVVCGAKDAADRTAEILMVHVDARGNTVGPSAGFVVSRTDAPIVSGPTSVTDGEGGAIVAWISGWPGSQHAFATRVPRSLRRGWAHDAALGTPASNCFGIQVIPSGRAGAIVTWQELGAEPSSFVRAQRVSRRGRIEWGARGALVGTAEGHPAVLLANDGRNGAYFAWAGERPDGRVFAMRLTRDGQRASGWEANGTPISQWPNGVVEHSSRAEGPWIAATGHGHAIVTWDAWQHVDGSPQNGFVEQSFAMLLTPGGPAASPSSAPKPRTVEPLRDVARTVTPAFALRSIRPNPAPSSAIVSFALPDPRPASLEMFDVAGRRVWSRSVGDLGPGEHDVRLRDGAWSAPGVYLVRLTQGERSATARVVIVR